MHMNPAAVLPDTRAAMEDATLRLSLTDMLSGECQRGREDKHSLEGVVVTPCERQAPRLLPSGTGGIVCTRSGTATARAL